MSFKVPIIYEDDSIICINKSATDLTLPDRYDTSKKNLLQYLTIKYGTIFPVHRLDKDTSGIMVWAKTAEAHKLLNIQFEERSVLKIYLAIAEGNPLEASGIIKNNLIYNGKGIGSVNPSKKGKLSVTEWKVLEQFSGFSLLEVSPKTGRQHQIRIHLKSISHPLAVDSLYGHRERIFAFELKNSKKYNRAKDHVDKPLIERHTLHAHSLSFIHPVKQTEIKVSAPLPKDMKALLNQLKKWKTL